MRYYEYRHTISFEETNVLGNTYFTNHLKWQGRCRELFLHDHARGVLEDLAAGLKLVTVRCSCEYEEELFALDVVSVRMRVRALKASGIVLDFDYVKLTGGHEAQVAHGQQEIACLRGSGGSSVVVGLPDALRDALEPFLESSAPVG